MFDMKQRWILFTWLFSGFYTAKASRSFISAEIYITMFVLQSSLKRSDMCVNNEFN